MLNEEAADVGPMEQKKWNNSIEMQDLNKKRHDFCPPMSANKNCLSQLENHEVHWQNNGEKAAKRTGKGYTSTSLSIWYKWQG